jgi:Ca-activated chloride channel family protein
MTAEPRMTPADTDRALDAACTGGRLVTTSGQALPLLSAHLRAEAGGGIARTVLVQVFRNVHAEPLQVTYLLPLPHAGAVGGFAFTVGGRRVLGEVDRLRRARERFEEAVLDGRSAALLEQERGALFTQQLGNVPPGATVEAEVRVDQRLDWRDAAEAGESRATALGAWEWRFPTVVAPRYRGGRAGDEARTSVPVADDTVAPHLGFELVIRDAAGRPSSPSHPIAPAEEAGVLRIAPAEGAAPALDRDLVIRWPAGAPEVGAALRTHRADGGRLGGRAFGLLTLVPPSPGKGPPATPRDLIVLLDASGSMSGEPLDQARRVIAALVGTLGEGDQLELIAFASHPVRWRPGPAAATESGRAEALRWLARLQAGGGTEMRAGIREALRGVRAGAQRQVVLITDGLIGFEQEVVAEIRAGLPEGSRVHTVGVGPAVNRSLTGPAARAGRGMEVVIGLGEDPERAAAALRARTAAPLVTGLRLSGSALRAQAPARLPDLHAGAPALVALELDPGGGALVVEGETAGGAFLRRLEVHPIAAGSGLAAIAALFGREAVEDLELSRAAGEEDAPLDGAVEQLGLDFQLATRRTAWVAVSEERTVDPTRPIRREEMPHALPHGMSAEGLGLRAASPRPLLAGVPAAVLMRSMAPPAPAGPGSTRPRRRGAVTRPLALDAREGSAPSTGSAARRLAASIRALPGRLVIEAQLDAALEWKPPARVEVRLQGSAPQGAIVDAGATTGPGTLSAGQVLRLVVHWDGALAADAVTEVQVELEGDLLVLFLRPA